MTLSLAYRIPIPELKARLGARDMMLLSAAYAEGLIPDSWLQTATICSTLANVHSDGKTVFTVAEFLPWNQRGGAQTAEQLEAGRQARIRDAEMERQSGGNR